MTYLPWVLSGYPQPDSLQKKAIRKEDHTNNLEYITINNPAAGKYTLHISASTLTTPMQKISVAFSLEAKNKFVWDYPSATDVLEAGHKSTLFWHSPDNQKGDLWYQLNHSDWQRIEQNIETDSYFHWHTPDTAAMARLKMSIGGIDYFSDSFLISPKLKVKVGYTCDDDFLLTWNATPGIDTCVVYALGEKYLEKVSTTTDTTIVLPSQTGSLYFSVAPKKNKTTGLKSLAFDYTMQGALCFVNFFSAMRFDKTKIIIQLRLSTSLHVKMISIYKSIGSRRALFSSFKPESLNYTFYDNELVPGATQYQAEVILHNGKTVLSEISEVFIEDQGRAILFPNPADNDELKILSEGSGCRLKILDNTGKTLIIKDLEYVLDTAEINNLSPGIYLFQLEKDGNLIDAGKFIKL
jgi:hypothetical protein